MRSLGISVVGVVILVLLFGMGIINSSPVPLLMGFCGWTPMIFVLGWSVRAFLIGKRWKLVREDEVETPISLPTNHRPKERITRIERNM